MSTDWFLLEQTDQSWRESGGKDEKHIYDGRKDKEYDLKRKKNVYTYISQDISK